MCAISSDARPRESCIAGVLAHCALLSRARLGSDSHIVDKAHLLTNHRACLILVGAMSLSSFIMQDLRSRIVSGKSVPESLSLTDLSRRYEVSITPVRNAVRILIDEGFIEKLPNKRLRINTSRIGTGKPDAPVVLPPTPTDRAETLLDEVVHESLGREPVYLREYSLAEKYGLGRSIIRQIFSRFAGAGLLEHVPRKGWLVHPFRRADLKAPFSGMRPEPEKVCPVARCRIF